MSYEVEIENGDVVFEEEVFANPHTIHSWLSYLNAAKDAQPEKRYIIWERALQSIPTSYKLWFQYLTERKETVKPLPVTHNDYTEANYAFERCLVFLHKMPRIWLEYLQFLMSQLLVTKTRQTFDKALRSLPVTQHQVIWALYLKWAKQPHVPPQTSLRIFRRYLKIEPERAEEFIDYLVEQEEADEACQLLAKVVNDDHFVSKQGKSKHDMWMMLCGLVTKYPNKVSLRVESVIRTALGIFKSEVGKLWASLAEYYVRLGNLHKAHDVYEEAISSVITIRDFTVIWDAYIEFEYRIISATSQEITKAQQEGKVVPAATLEMLDLRYARYKDLIERQAIIKTDVVLRQNPNNVKEWHTRIQLFKAKPKLMVAEYTQALKTVDPAKALGKFESLWIAFARYLEDQGQLGAARKVFKTATETAFKKLDALASVWCEWIEMELRHNNAQEALKLVQQATAVPGNYKALLKAVNSQKDHKITVQQRLFKATRLWALYADLEESYGTYETCKAVYDRIIELRIASPMIILNYARFLEQHQHFEESFRVYEQGVDIFKYPHAEDIWLTYLVRFTERFKGKKPERTRDLFEQALEAAPAAHAKLIFLLYATFEEKHGLARHAMQVLERATKTVPEIERPKLYNIYIVKATQLFGVARTREIFESAIESLPDKFVRGFCLRYAQLERKLVEIDRARAIYTHCAQFCDPAVDGQFWDIWSEFEESHGNRDTYTDMLRVRKGVVAKFSSGANLLASQLELARRAREEKEAKAKEAAAQPKFEGVYEDKDEEIQIE